MMEGGVPNMEEKRITEVKKICRWRLNVSCEKKNCSTTLNMVRLSEQLVQ